MSFFGSLKQSGILWSARRLPKDKRENVLVILSGSVSKKMAEIEKDRLKLLEVFKDTGPVSNDVVRLSWKLKDFCSGENRKRIESKELLKELDVLCDHAVKKSIELRDVLFVEEDLPVMFKEIERSALREAAKQLNL